LLVLLRLWRLLKLTTAITVSQEEYHETAEQQEIVRLRSEVEKLRKELRKEIRRKGGLAHKRRDWGTAEQKRRRAGGRIASGERRHLRGMRRVDADALYYHRFLSHLTAS
jgi:hypothetical protein